MWVCAGAGAAVAGLVTWVLSTSIVVAVLGAVLLLVGSLTCMTAAIGVLARRELRRQAELVSTTAERWLVEVLPPARILRVLLNSVYGESDANQAVVTALLGGDGERTDGSDMTISRSTDIGYRLRRLDESLYRLTMRAEYAFRNQVPSTRVVIFATSDTRLRDSIVSACRVPLFELVFVREDEESLPFAESVELVRESIRIGLVYADRQGKTHRVDAVNPGENLVDERLTEWGRFLTMFRGDESDRALRPGDYMNRLRIFTVQLPDLARGLPAVSTIERLIIESSTTQQVVDSFCFWQAPYPCFVDSMWFDTSSFALDGEHDLCFFLKPFSMGTNATPTPWWGTKDRDVTVPLREWFLVGHGAALVWCRRSPLDDRIHAADEARGGLTPSGRRSIDARCTSAHVNGSDAAAGEVNGSDAAAGEVNGSDAAAGEVNGSDAAAGEVNGSDAAAGEVNGSDAAAGNGSESEIGR